MNYKVFVKKNSSWIETIPSMNKDLSKREAEIVKSNLSEMFKNKKYKIVESE